MIDERDWVFACRTPQAWASALAWKRSQRLGALRAIRGAASVSYFLEHGAQADTIVLHPSFHAWLHRFEHGAGDRLRAFSGFAAAAALVSDASLALEVRLDDRGRFHLHGLARYFDLGPGAAGASARLTAAADRWELKPRSRPGLVVAAEALRAGRGRGVGALSLIAGRMELNSLDPLVLSAFGEGGGAYDHKVEPLEGQAAANYIRVLRKAVSHIGRFDATLHEELLTDIRVLVPLRNRRRLTSVSSTYSSLQGAIGLSHSPDPIVQAETLIHEFSHNKLNLLLDMTSLFDSGSPSEASFYSPWREDLRPLRGLLLGSHAFLNTARFGGWCLQHLELESAPRRQLFVHVCQTLLRVESALRTLASYGVFTPGGRRLLVAMTTALTELKQTAANFPATVRAEARRAFDAHRAKHGGLDSRGPARGSP